MTRVLLVDDDAELGRLLTRFFSAHPVDLAVCGNGRDGLRQAIEGGFNVVLLDVMLPVLDGFEVLRQIRRRSDLPVMMLTARSEHEDRMAGFRGGADDYLAKPFHPEELLARCLALQRRSQSAAQAGSPEPVEVGGVLLDSARRQAFSGREPLELTVMEFDILDILARSAGRIVTRDEIWATLHHREPSPFERALDTHLRNLRKKLNGRSSIAIRTVRSAGYVLSASQ
jgi:two-component system response regulator CpxR